MTQPTSGWEPKPRSRPLQAKATEISEAGGADTMGFDDENGQPRGRFVQASLQREREGEV